MNVCSAQHLPPGVPRGSEHFFTWDLKEAHAKSATKPWPDLGFISLLGTVSLHFVSFLSLQGEDFLFCAIFLSFSPGLCSRVLGAPSLR